MVSLGWDHARVEHGLNIPRLKALQALWKHTPPINVTARVIAQILGAKFESPPVSAVTKPITTETVQSLADAGFVPVDGRPADPMLDLLLKTL